MRSPNEKINVLQNGYGVSIEYTLEADEKINAFINGMMTHNDIKGILGYIYEANNGVRKLRFNHPDGIQLSLLLAQTLRRQTLLSILGNIANTVCLAEEYMLSEGGFVFDTQLIYVNTTTLDTNLIYIPTGISGNLTYCLFVKNVIYSSIVNTTEDTAYVQQIANLINSNPHISTAELGEFIRSLAAEVQRMPNVVHAAEVKPQVSVPHSQPTPVSANHVPAALQASAAPVSGREESANKKAGLFAGFAGKKKPKKVEKPVKEQPANGFGFSIPGQPAAARANSGGFGFDIPGQPPAKKPVPSTPAAPPHAPQAPQAPRTPVQQPSYAAVSNNVAQPAPMQEDDFQDGKTVLLSTAGSNGAQKPQVFLEKKSGERIYITKNNFFIGKADKADIANDYIIKNNAVSRNHAYLQLTANGASITDNNSSNGTFVNGERIPSMVNTELKNGDAVRLANEEFVFRIV